MLGKVTANGQALEFVTCKVLGRCLQLPANDDSSAIRVGQRLTMAGRLDLIAELAEIGLAPADVERMRVWLTSARTANERRNTIVHSAWVGDPMTNEFGGALTKKGKLEPGWGEAEMQDAIDRLREAIEGALALLQ